MNLTEYLKSVDERPYKFAVKAGVSVPLCYDLISMEKGDTRHSREILLKNALKIRAASGNLIDLARLGTASHKP